MSAISAAGIPMEDWLNAAGLSATAAGGGMNAGVLSGSGSSGNGGEGPPPVDLAALRDLAGVPVPTAADSGSGSGSAPLGAAPLWCGSPDMVSLVPRLAARFVHPDMASSSSLVTLMTHPSFKSELRVSPFAAAQLAAELPNVLPPHLSPANAGNQPTMPWSVGGGISGADEDLNARRSPSPRWLRAFWREVGQSPPDTLDIFASWPLIPVVGGELVRVVRFV